jgi:hypothetical protein
MDRPPKTGTRGTRSVTRRLNRLGDDWRVIRPDQDVDVDHIVIGPSGVFTLSTKTHRGGSVWVAGQAFLVNGVKQPYLQRSRVAGERATSWLSSRFEFPVRVVPVIVVIAHRLAVKVAPQDVQVVGRRAIRRWLLNQPPALSSGDVSAIYEQSRQNALWSVGRE